MKTTGGTAMAKMVYAVVEGGRFPRRTTVALTIPDGSLRERFQAIEAWKAGCPGLRYFSLLPSSNEAPMQ